jgi:hypothetical protein
MPPRRWTHAFMDEMRTKGDSLAGSVIETPMILGFYSLPAAYAARKGVPIGLELARHQPVRTDGVQPTHQVG